MTAQLYNDLSKKPISSKGVKLETRGESPGGSLLKFVFQENLLELELNFFKFTILSSLFVEIH
jgi:hypothetical protein